MKTRTCLAIRAAVLACVSLCSAATATDYTWSGSSGGNWADNANWGGAGFPKDAGDGALFDGATAQMDIGVNQAVTCGVIRLAAGAAGIYKIGTAVAGNTIYMQASSGNALITNKANNTDNQDFYPPVTVWPLSDLDIANGNGRIVNFYCDFAGDKTVNLYRWGANGTIQFAYKSTAPGGMPDSPNFTGTLRCKGTGQAILFRSSFLTPYSQYFFTNPAARVVVESKGELNVYYGTNGWVHPRITVEHGGNLTVRRQPAITKYLQDITVVGSNRYSINGGSSGVATMNPTADFTGTGTVYIADANVILQLTGSVSPGFGIGTLEMQENNGVLEIGTSTDPVTLNINMAPTASDQLVLQGLDTPFDPARSDLVLSGDSLGSTQSIIIANAIAGASVFNSVTFQDGAVTGDVIYDYAGGVVMAYTIPEPIYLGACALFLLIARRT